MNTKTTVFVTTRFEGLHKWGAAPSEVSYLQHYHRHIFHVKVSVIVNHDDRDVEFIQFKWKLEDYLQKNWHRKCFDWSCEKIASLVFEHFSEKYQIDYVEVSEDGENGAVVTRVEGNLKQEPSILPSIDLPSIELSKMSVTKPIKEEQSIATKVRTKCFIGTEAEGPNRGAKVLFIPGSTTPQELERIIRTNPVSGIVEPGKANRVYYGAGNDRTFRPDTFEVLSNWASTSIVDLEVESVTEEVRKIWLYKKNTRVNIISLDIQDINNEYCDWFKVVSDKYVVWIGQDTKSIITCLDDPLYLDDMEID